MARRVDHPYATVLHSHADYVTTSIFSLHLADAANPHAVTKAQVGLGNADNTSDANKPVSTAQATAIAVVQTDITTHKANVSNPHSVTKSQVGLGSVDNTSDANKPVSIAQQTALDLKANLASPTFTGTVGGITKSMVGLANVDNTSDANKPVSTAQQTALNLKANLASPTFTGTVGIPSGTTLPLPVIADLTNAVHTHQSTAGGGSLNAAAITAGVIGTARLASTGTPGVTTFLRGDQSWSVPAGGGDVVGPAASVDSEISLFSGTTGKIIKRATTTGLLKAASGVLAAAVAGTDYYNPGGTDVAVADGGTGASTAAAARTSLGVEVAAETLISETSFSAAASNSLNNQFSATYETYRVEISNLLQSASANLNMRLRVGGVDNATSNYYTGGIESFSTSATSVYLTASAVGLWVIHIASGITLSDGSYTIWFTRPQVAAPTVMRGIAGMAYVTASVGSAGAFFGGSFNAATQFDGFSIVPSSGNISCKVRVYGLRNTP